MTRSRLFACLVAVAGCRSEQSPPPGPTPGSATTPLPSVPAPAPPIDKAALLAGMLPDTDPTTEVVNAQCRICHSVDYLTQQRLGEPAWKKTIEKMRKFGANLTDAEATAMVSYAARYWSPDLPPRTWALVAPPAGALPIAPASNAKP